MAERFSGGGMAVSTLLGAPVVRIGSEATLLDAADALSAADVGMLVVGDGDAAEGVLSERDVVRALAARRDPATVPVGEVANTDLLWCDEAASVAEVANRMMDRFVRHALVEQGGRLVGVVSARDLLSAYATEGEESDEGSW